MIKELIGKKPNVTHWMPVDDTRVGTVRLQPPGGMDADDSYHIAISSHRVEKEGPCSMLRMKYKEQDGWYRHCSLCNKYLTDEHLKSNNHQQACAATLDPNTWCNPRLQA